MPTTEKTTRELRRALQEAKAQARLAYKHSLEQTIDVRKLARLDGRIEGIEVAERLVKALCG